MCDCSFLYWHKVHINTYMCILTYIQYTCTRHFVQCVQFIVYCSVRFRMFWCHSTWQTSMNIQLTPTDYTYVCVYMTWSNTFTSIYPSEITETLLCEVAVEEQPTACQYFSKEGNELHLYNIYICSTCTTKINLVMCSWKFWNHRRAVSPLLGQTLLGLFLQSHRQMFPTVHRAFKMAAKIVTVCTYMYCA